MDKYFSVKDRYFLATNFKNNFLKLKITEKKKQIIVWTVQSLNNAGRDVEGTLFYCKESSARQSNYCLSPISIDINTYFWRLHIISIRGRLKRSEPKVMQGTLVRSGICQIFYTSRISKQKLKFTHIEMLLWWLRIPTYLLQSTSHCLIS